MDEPETTAQRVHAARTALSTALRAIDENIRDAAKHHAAKHPTPKHHKPKETT